MRLFLTISLACASAFAAGNPEENLRALLQAKTGAIHLPVGTIEITREIVLPTGAHDLEILGAGTVLKASAAFRGRALLVIPGGTNIKISGLSIDGARDTTGRMTLVPPEGRLISRVVANNGALIEGVTGLDLADIKAVHVAGFALVIGSSRNIRLHDIEVSESGGFDPQLRNNGAGGIALEDGVANFELTRCRFGGIRGNGVTIRSAGHGRIAENEFAVMARDAIEVHQANALVIENNRARQIGAPTEEVAGRAECMRLENLSDSVVNGNTCEETLLGAIVLSGSRNTITGNRLLHLNLAQKIEPGIYLAGPASGNTVEGNVIGGSGMSSHCVEMAPTLPKDANRSIKNDCSDEASVAGLRAPWGGRQKWVLPPELGELIGDANRARHDVHATDDGHGDGAFVHVGTTTCTLWQSRIARIISYEPGLRSSWRRAVNTRQSPGTTARAIVLVRFCAGRDVLPEDPLFTSRKLQRERVDHALSEFVLETKHIANRRLGGTDKDENARFHHRRPDDDRG